MGRDALPAFSVVIPTFNRVDDLRTTLHSLCALSSPPEFEVIVADDGSSDGSELAVTEYSLPLRYEWNENEGVSAARNRGAAMAVGSYVVFLDTGDHVDDDWLATLARLAHAENADMVTCGRRDVCLGSTHDGPADTIRDEFIYVPSVFSPGCFCLRTGVWKEIGGYDMALRYAENTDLGWRVSDYFAAHEERHTVHTSAPLVTHVVPPGGSYAGSAPNRYSAAVHILRKHDARLSSQPRLKATYERIAGIAAARMGDHAVARRHLLRAAADDPRNWKNHARALVGLSAHMQSRVWAPLRQG